MAALPVRYVSRQAWGARAPQSKPESLPSSAVDTVYFHYTGSRADRTDSHANCAARVRGVQAYHIDNNGWNDIAYSYLVCRHGFIFVGRGLAKSAATGADNSHSLAVCFLGGDQERRDDVTAEGREALVNVTRWLRQQRPRLRVYAGHRDRMATACPGDEIHRYIHSNVFAQQVVGVDGRRLATLRGWILKRRAEGWGWKRLKASANYREYSRRGGR